MPKQSETFAFADEPPKEQPRSEFAPAQRLLNFLQRWDGDSVTLRDLRVWGPRFCRDPSKAVSAAKTLVEFGWLAATKPHWPGTYAWRIIRKNIVRPAVDM
jgi:hypothetical protein